MVMSQSKHLRIQILLSFLTLLLAPLFSAIVVYYQLSKEHEFRGVEHKLVERKAVETKKAKLFQDTYEIYWRFLNSETNVDTAWFRIWYQWTLFKIADERKILFFDIAKNMRPKPKEMEGGVQLYTNSCDKRDELKAQLISLMAAIPDCFGIDSEASKITGEAMHALTLHKREAGPPDELIKQMKVIMRKFGTARNIDKIWFQLRDAQASYINRSIDNKFYNIMKKLLLAMVRETWPKPNEQSTVRPSFKVIKDGQLFDVTE